ncbi:MAG: ATP-binding protein [Cyanobacteria bacterium J06635_15]
MQHLLLIEDDQGKRAVPLTAATSSIGRDAGNSIVLHSKEVSRQHAILLRVTRPGKHEFLFRLIDGNLQGNPSTNGLFVNGKRCSSHDLRQGDTIIFGAQVKARYYIAKSDGSLERLLAGDDGAEDFMATLIAAPMTQSTEVELEKLHDAALARLASFPELFSHPIIEISLAGELTYLNPAAVHQFPEIQVEKLQHPLLVGIIDIAKSQTKQHYQREINVGERVFEQSFHHISESELIRSYLVEITERKQAETELKALHDLLEEQVKTRTMQFMVACERLQKEEKALIASYATNRALLNAIPDPMFRINRVGEFVNFKEPKHHTLPFEPEACLHCHLSEVLPHPVAEAMQTGIHQALATEEIQVLEFQLTVDEILLDFEARIAVSADNEVVAIIRDITERKRGEADIRNALERERELNEMKTRFVSMTSHEFRTPLTTILSSAELLEHYGERWSMAKQLKYLHKIQIAAKHMTELLNDVLLINQAEAGKVEFNPQPLVLNEFCQEIMEELQITTAAHHLRLRSQLTGAPILIDRKLMRHILTNLLSNAVNYSPSGGEILISLDEVGNQLELRVQDQGIGIPEEAHNSLFESFVRGSNVGTISGTGLGLAIVKKSVDLHQGQIRCESEVGKGTTFIVTLPVSLPQALPVNLFPEESAISEVESVC